MATFTPSVDLRGAEAQLNRRSPGRADRRAGDPDGSRAAWAGLERTWAAALERVAAMPAGAVDDPVGGEWSFAQTLRHLVLAVPRKNPHDPEHQETNRSCLQVIPEEEWEHHRYARRDLDAIEAKRDA